MEADLNQMHSQAEKTIRENHPPDNTLQDYIPLVTGNDGNVYSKNPHNNYASRFADGFLGHLSCGSVDHLFRTFPDKATNDMEQKSQDLWSHVSSTRKSPTNIPAPKVTFTTPAVTSTSNINILSTHTNPHISNINFLVY